MACRGGVGNKGLDPSTVFAKASEWVKERVHDEKHFTTRWLKQAEEGTGVNRCIVSFEKAGRRSISSFRNFGEEEMKNTAWEESVHFKPLAEMYS